MPIARDLVSRRIVKGFPFERLESLADQIVANRAEICAVIKPRTVSLLGLIRFSDIAANPSISIRILADLMRTPSGVRLLDSDPVERLVEIIHADPDEVIVEAESGAFVGLVTPESFLRWLVTAPNRGDFNFTRLPRNSAWNPSPTASE